MADPMPPVTDETREAVLVRPVDTSQFTWQDLGALPPPQAPAALPDFQPPSRSASAGPLGLGALVATLIAGPQGGGAAAKGYLEGMQRLDDQALEQWKVGAQQQARQDALYQRQAAQADTSLRYRQQLFGDGLTAFQKSAARAQTRSEYEAKIQQFSTLMQQQGFRMVTPDYLRQQSSDWLGKSDQQLLHAKIDDWFKVHREEYTRNPLLLSSATILAPEDGNPSGKEMKLTTAMRLANRMTELTALFGSGEQFSGTTQAAAKSTWMQKVAAYAAEHNGAPPPDDLARRFWDESLAQQRLEDRRRARDNASDRRAGDPAVSSGAFPDWVMNGQRPTEKDAPNKPDPQVGMSPNALYQTALDWLTSGKMPPVGLGNSGYAVKVRTAVQTKAGAIAADAGMDVPEFRATFSADKGSLAALQKNTDSVQSFIRTADDNAELLKRAIAPGAVVPQGYPDAGSPLVNKTYRWFLTNASGRSGALAKVNVYLQSLASEYGRIINSANLGGVLTDSARHEAEQLLSPDATIQQILDSLAALKAEGDNRIRSFGEQLSLIRGRMSGMSNTERTPAVPPPAQSGFGLSYQDYLKQRGGR